MTTTPAPLSPAQVQGLDLSEAVLMLARDKLVFTRKGSTEHLTVHLGPTTGELDLHRTVTAPGGQSAHTRLFAIAHGQLGLLLEEIGPAFAAELRASLRPLRPGWMSRHRIVPVLGPVDVSSATTLRRRRLSVDPDKLKAAMRPAASPQELYDLPDGQSFSLFSVKNRRVARFLGLGFKATGPAGRPHLLWLGKHEAMALCARFMTRLETSARKHGTVHVEPPWLQDESQEKRPGFAAGAHWPV